MESLLGFAVKQKKYILEVLHNARKPMKRAPEVTVFSCAVDFGVFQGPWMVFLELCLQSSVLHQPAQGLCSCGYSFLLDLQDST